MTQSSDSFLDLSPYFEQEKIRAGFSLVSFPNIDPDDRAQLANKLGLISSKLVVPKQVHDTRVQFCSASGEFADTDAIISNSDKVVLSIQVADCIPLYILETKSKMLGLVHAGWRGIAMGIISKTIDKFEKYHGNTNKMIVLIGPSIHQCCFEIGPEVAEKFSVKFLIAGENDRVFLDLQGVVKDQLLNTGIKNENIIDLEECTCCQPGKFHSYRREGNKAGRMIAVFGWV